MATAVSAGPGGGRRARRRWAAGGFGASFEVKWLKSVSGEPGLPAHRLAWAGSRGVVLPAGPGLGPAPGEPAPLLLPFIPFYLQRARTGTSGLFPAGAPMSDPAGTGCQPLGEAQDQAHRLGHVSMSSGDPKPFL